MSIVYHDVWGGHYYGKENDGAYQIIDEECDISIDLCNPYCYIGMQRKGWLCKGRR